MPNPPSGPRPGRRSSRSMGNPSSGSWAKAGAAVHVLASQTAATVRTIVFTDPRGLGGSGVISPLTLSGVNITTTTGRCIR